MKQFDPNKHPRPVRETTGKSPQPDRPNYNRCCREGAAMAAVAVLLTVLLLLLLLLHTVVGADRQLTASSPYDM